LVLLFKVEIAGALTESPNDSQIVKSIKQPMIQALDYTDYQLRNCMLLLQCLTHLNAT